MKNNNKPTIIIFAVVATLAVLVMYKPTKPDHTQDDRQRYQKVVLEMRTMAVEASERGESPNSRDDYRRKPATFITALWSSMDDAEPLDANYAQDDIAPQTLATMKADCETFQQAHAADIAADPEQAGHDFWLTRNHHGAGFWDDDWPEAVGERLTQAAHVFGGVDLYVGDDGLIHG